MSQYVGKRSKVKSVAVQKVTVASRAKKCYYLLNWRLTQVLRVYLYLFIFKYMFLSAHEKTACFI